MNFVEPIKDKNDIEKMKLILKRNGYRDYFLFTLGINIGLRIGDLLKLKTNDLKDFDKNSIKSIIYMKDNKTNKINNFPIIPELALEIEKYIEIMGLQEGDYLFQSRKGLNRSITPDRAYMIVRNAGEEIGLKHIGSHTLRKTFAFWFYHRNNKDIALTMEMLNHSSPKDTIRYLGIDIDYKREALKGGFL